MAEGKGAFPSTHWSQVARAAVADPAARLPALEALLTRYYAALRAHLIQARRLRPEQADDVLHDFVCDKILRQRLLEAADRGRGRFRNLLLTALDRYLVSCLRRDGAAKRAPADTVPVDALAECLGGGPVPSDAFDVAWAREVVAEATRRMQAECARTGRPDVWGVFEERVLVPIAHDTAPAPYEALVRRHGLASPTAAYNLLLTAKRLYARCLESVVGEYAAGPHAAAREVADLHAVLQRAGGKNGTAAAYPVSESPADEGAGPAAETGEA